MKYYVFKKKISTPSNCRVILTDHNIYKTKDFEAAVGMYNFMNNGKMHDEVVYLMVDFGKGKLNYMIPETGYFPFLILECSDPGCYDYEGLYGIRDLKLFCLSDGIEQTFNSTLSAIKKFEYYLKYRIGSTLCARYSINKEEHVASLIDSNSILLGKYNSYLKNIILWNPDRNKEKFKTKIKNFFKPNKERVEV